MDADTLRWILIVLGGLFLVSLYLWEKRRAAPSDPDESYQDSEPEEDKLEPRLGGWEDQAAGDEEPEAAAGRAPEQSWSPPPPPPEPQPPHENPAVAPDGPDGRGPKRPRSPLILSLHLLPTKKNFSGEAIVHAATRCNIDPGELEIFHRYKDGEADGQLLFSMANMVEPGTFPFGAMAKFESPGLTLFSQADGTSDDPDRLEAMLAAAHCLADSLKAEIQDEKRAPLTPETEERLRDRVHELVAWRLTDMSSP